MDDEQPLDAAAHGTDGDRVGGRSPGCGGESPPTPAVESPDGALQARLDRVVALASGPAGRPPHGELLDELRALVREAERPCRPPGDAAKEVVERPARRLHGT